ncbi:MAG: PD-(D/E)XK nuclease family protein, partial [Acetatifactor sp.]|nr:PD-(D/E)XK nuclease family protein [Acetatifactor sp.]
YNYFMVGDVKQSIYRFRLARPQLFLDKYHSYEEDGEKIRIDLAKNFRSRAEVLDAVNGVFGHIMRREVGDIDYDDSAALHLGAEYPENTGDEAELLLVEKPAKDSDESAKEAEASAVAHKIKDLMGSLQVTDKESKVLRPVRYSDIVILLRTTTGWDEVFRKVLENQGIPAYASSKSGYFNALEVQELLQFLKVLDNATQDIPLFGVMKSVFGGFREEEIAKIRIRNRKMSLYEALKCYAVDPEEEKLGQKAAAFLEMIGKYRKMTVYLPVRDLLTKIVNDFEYLNYVTALPAGSKRKANVEMLFIRASDFEKTSYFGLFHFLRYMDQLQKYEVDFGEGELLDENADVVRIMSIHKSKGLEFPVTFVAGMSKQFNMEDTTGALLLDVDMGLGVDYVDPVGRTTNKTLRKKVLSLKLKKDTLSEELRILYVALTRAKEKLIMTGVLKDAESALTEAYEDPDDQLSFADFVSAASYRDLVLPIIGNTAIQSSVVAEEEKAAGDVGEQVDLMLRKNRLLHSGELCDERALEKLRDRLNREYAFANLAGLYTKTTVSELKIAAMADKDEAAFHDFEEKEVQPYIPSFRREEEEVTGTVRGNAYHRVMELLDFDAEEELTEESLAAFLDEETASRRLPKEYRDVVNLKKILRFRRSELGQRMHRASLQGKLFREQPFVLGIAADRVNPEFPEREKVLIQGIIDVFWEEEDGLVLLDYKTDSVNSLKELWNRYETQLDYYSEALTRIYGKPVKERYLYSFRLESF